MSDAAPWPLATTRLVALLGWPARYSLSPAMHNAAFRADGHDLVYVVLPCGAEAVADVVRMLAEVDALGANVTVPHKQTVYALCDTRTDEAELIGAVNTLSFAGGQVAGDNTDALGLVDAWSEQIHLRGGDRLAVLGTGGAARATVVAGGRLGLDVSVIGRDDQAARELAALAARAGARAGNAVQLADAADAVADSRLVVNATPLGMAGEELPAPFMALSHGQIAYDLVYDPPTTPFLAAARNAGAEAFDGLGMLIGQAARSFRRWTAHDAPREVMSAAVVRALAERGTAT